ncbi:hypothetical protein DFH08DRAFT_960567 [Mycena albidolilacea]|uniref:Uncharacterized protein n=1 Tax=Mycena albidolilacea TaxID=1033008 RepID=A0AAD7A0P2_9AGAR|nr:hypothetical protein DFH08DRAFT_960567 [Mycena albidolilacea]
MPIDLGSKPMYLGRLPSRPGSDSKLFSILHGPSAYGRFLAGYARDASVWRCLPMSLTVIAALAMPFSCTITDARLPLRAPPRLSLDPARTLPAPRCFSRLSALGSRLSAFRAPTWLSTIHAV